MRDCTDNFYFKEKRQQQQQQQQKQIKKKPNACWLDAVFNAVRIFHSFLATLRLDGSSLSFNVARCASILRLKQQNAYATAGGM